MRNDNDALMEAVKSAYRSKMVAAAVAALLIGLVGGFFLGKAQTGDSGTSTAAASEQAPAAEYDTAGGWSAEGAKAEAPLADPTAPLPKGVNDNDSTGMKIPFAWNLKEFKDGIPTVTIWEDFQCPACKAFETTPAIKMLLDKANAGEINLQFRPLAFLDMNLRNDSSVRATAAWGCAIDAGVGEKYRELVFANQPAQEGQGFTDAELLSGGKLAGLEGDAYTQFEDCFKAGTYKAWGGTSTAATPQEVGGTPTVMIDGIVVDPKKSWDEAELVKAIDAAKK